jgi:putative hydrolase of the HAD superfamily
MPLSFFYFDLGNVLLHFDHHRAARQMADVAGLDTEQVYELVFEGDLERRCELGELTAGELYEIFCEKTGTKPDFDELERAGSNIFELNMSILSVVGQLDAAGYRLGVLSNTSDSHWRFASDGRFGILNPALGMFDEHVLSYEVGAMKPDPQIFAAAADKAGVPVGEVFFTDDRPENVDGARNVGFDAVLYTTTPQLVRDLLARKVRFNG